MKIPLLQPIIPVQTVFMQKKILQTMHFVSFPVSKQSSLQYLLPHLGTLSSDNKHIIKANVFSNRLVCSGDQEDTICSEPGKRMTPAAITLPEPFFLFFSHGT